MQPNMYTRKLSLGLLGLILLISSTTVDAGVTRKREIVSVGDANHRTDTNTSTTTTTTEKLVGTTQPYGDLQTTSKVETATTRLENNDTNRNDIDWGSSTAGGAVASNDLATESAVKINGAPRLMPTDDSTSKPNSAPPSVTDPTSKPSGAPPSVTEQSSKPSGAPPSETDPTSKSNSVPPFVTDPNSKLNGAPPSETDPTSKTPLVTDPTSKPSGAPPLVSDPTSKPNSAPLSETDPNSKPSGTPPSVTDPTSKPNSTPPLVTEPSTNSEVNGAPPLQTTPTTPKLNGAPPLVTTTSRGSETTDPPMTSRRNKIGLWMTTTRTEVIESTTTSKLEDPSTKSGQDLSVTESNPSTTSANEIESEGTQSVAKGSEPPSTTSKRSLTPEMHDSTTELDLTEPTKETDSEVRPSDDASTSSEVSTDITTESSWQKGAEPPLSTPVYETDHAATTPSPVQPKATTIDDIATNEIRETTTPQILEKRAKFMKDNSSNTNDLILPGNADAWALAGMKTAIDKDIKEARNNSGATKSLTDWSHIMKEVEVFNASVAHKQREENEVAPSVFEKPTEQALPSIAISERPENNQVVPDFEIVLDKPRNVSTTTEVISVTTTPTINNANLGVTQSSESSPKKTSIEVTQVTPEVTTVSSMGRNSSKSTTETTESELDGTETDLGDDEEQTSTTTTSATFKVPIISTPESSIETNAIDRHEDPPTPITTEQTITPGSTPVIHLLPSTLPTIVDNAVDATLTPKREDEYFIHTSAHPPIAVAFPVPKLADVTTETSKELDEPPQDEMDPNLEPQETDYNVIIAISVSVVGIVALILLVGFLYVMRKRQKQMSYGQRCRPVSLDAYSLDNVSVYNSVRRKGAMRASKRSYGNVAFDDPSLKHNVLGTHELARFVEKKSAIYEEFKDVPQIIARADEVPQGCDDKNRYANVVPLPETRVILQQLNGDERTEYINGNYVRGPKDAPNYYIACQGPLDSTVADFWRMIWEQNSRVIIMATDLLENGIEKCAEYLPPSVTLDNHTVHGDFQVTLKNREVKEKYALSTVIVKNTQNNTSREITHYWYQWPVVGVPVDEAAIIAMLLEARSALKTYSTEQSDTRNEADGNEDTNKSNGDSLDKPKSSAKNQGPLTVHCSNGTGRTGTVIACDMAIRSLETPKRTVDIPQIVYYVRRGRASAIQTKEQYEFIYRVTQMYATKLYGPINDN